MKEKVKKPKKLKSKVASEDVNSDIKPSEEINVNKKKEKLRLGIGSLLTKGKNA